MKKKIIILLFVMTFMTLGFQNVFSQNYTHCYIHIYENDGLDNGGAHLIVVGPMSSTTMELLPDCGSKTDWNDSIASISVGPGAWAVVYSGDNYTGRSLFLGPNCKIKNLEQFGMLDDIGSMIIYDKNPAANAQWIYGDL